MKNGKKLPLIAYYSLLLSVFFTACTNPWMEEILEPKTITFNSNGGSLVSSQKLYRGQKVERPADPYRNGCDFLGWFEDDKTFEIEWIFSEIPTKDLTLYAHWEGEGNTIITTVDQLKAFLDSQPDNTKSTPYTVVMEIDDPKLLTNVAQAISDSGKYVYLDLSGSTLTTIPDTAFYSSLSFEGCKTLTGITIPNGVDSIGNSAFNGCSNLESVIIPNGVTNIGADAFRDCTRPYQRNHTQQRYQHWATGFLQMHRPYQRNHTQQRYQHWRKCFFPMQQPCQRNHRKRRYQH